MLHRHINIISMTMEWNVKYSHYQIRYFIVKYFGNMSFECVGIR